MRRLKTILQSKYLFKIIACLMLLYSLLMIYFYPFSSKYNIDETEVVGTVTKYKIDGNMLTIYLKAKENLIAYYYFDTEEEKIYYQDNLLLGDKVKITGELSEPSNNTVPNLFNYKKYLKYSKIFYLVSAEKIEKLENNSSILYYLKNIIIKRIDSIDETGYLRTFILGDKTFLDDDTISTYQNNGISHLFSISGMHVSLIASMILFLLGKVSYNNFYKYGIITIVLMFYLFLTGFAASIVRTTIMFILSSINRCFNLKIKALDIMLLTLSVAIIINPFIICKVGFQFSYIISLTLVLFNKKVTEKKTKLGRSLYISYLCFLVSFPICIYNFYQVNFISIFLNLIMIPFVSIIVFPMTLVVFVLPIIYPLYTFVIEFMEFLNNLVGSITIFEFVFAKPSLFVIFIYYLFIYLSLLKKRYLILLLALVTINKIYPYLNSNFIFTVIDVGQGDSIFIKLPFNKGNILIDTGGKVSFGEDEEWEIRSTDSSIVTNKTIPYLKSLGIEKIDYLILTHGDYDHMGEAVNLVNNFKVSNVIFNKGEYNTLETELIEELKLKKISYFKSKQSLKIDEYIFYFLNQTIYEDENYDSNIIYFKYNGYKFLLQGDASIENEKEIISKYKLENIDVLKVGHHGSNTSSCQEFIDYINPRYSAISVGKNNRYGHPSKDVLEILENSTIYRTDKQGSIVFKIKEDKLEIETLPP